MTAPIATASWTDTIMALPPALIALIGLALTGLYCALAVRKLQGDWEPSMGRAVARPQGVSPPTLRWLRTGRIDTASLMAAILSLAGKGALDVEVENRHVRLRKRAEPAEKLTRAEHLFAFGLLRLSSTILLNQNAEPSLKRGAAALQDGIDAEWRAYQKGRIGSLFRPAIVIAWIALAAAAYLSSTTIWVGARGALAGCALILAVRCLAVLMDSQRRLWWEPGYYLARTIFFGIATLAALGTLWMLLTYQGGRPDPAAAACGALAIALPALVKLWIIRGRGAAGPVLGHSEALRNQLLGRAQGIDAIAFAPLSETPSEAAVSTVTALVPAEAPLVRWLPDAVALDAVPTPPAARIGGLAMAFENPDRLAAVLRVAAHAARIDHPAAGTAAPARG